MRLGRPVLPITLLAALAAQSAWGQSNADRKQEVEMAFDHYTAVRTDDQRVAVLDFLQHFDRKLVADALIDHIIASRNGVEATAYDQLVEGLNPDGCAAVIDRLSKTADAVPKGKLVVALRHCPDSAAIHAIAGCLDDKRPVPFEAHGSHPRRVCDLAYDELFLKLRADPRYGFDPSPHLIGIITEKTPTKTRDALIAKLKVKLAATPAPSATPATTPAPTASPEPTISPSAEKPVAT